MTGFDLAAADYPLLEHGRRRWFRLDHLALVGTPDLLKGPAALAHDQRPPSAAAGEREGPDVRRLPDCAGCRTSAGCRTCADCRPSARGRTCADCRGRATTRLAPGCACVASGVATLVALPDPPR